MSMHICLAARINEVNVYSTYKHSIQVSAQEENWFWLIVLINQRMVVQIKMDPCFFSTFEKLEVWQPSVCDEVYSWHSSEQWQKERETRSVGLNIRY